MGELRLVVEVPEVLAAIQELKDTMGQALDLIKTELAETKTVTQSVVVLVQGMSTKLAELLANASGDTISTQDLADLKSEFDANQAELAALVSANTPAAPIADVPAVPPVVADVIAATPGADNAAPVAAPDASLPTDTVTPVIDSAATPAPDPDPANSNTAKINEDSVNKGNPFPDQA